MGVLASQLTMAHLGSSCYSGPHSYATPFGFTTPTYELRADIQGSVVVQAERISEGFQCFSLYGDEPLDCGKESFIRQHVSVRLQSTGPKNIHVEVQDAWEAMSIHWPDQSIVVIDGLALDFRSPPLVAHHRPWLPTIA